MSHTERRALAAGAVALALSDLLTARPATADVFFLDFLAPTQAGQYNYSVADREAIRALVAADYAPFGHTVVTTQPTSGTFSRIQINATTDFDGEALEGGIAQGIDFRNLSSSDQARVNTGGLLGSAGAPPNTVANQIALTATIAAHEGGHLLGLRHHDGCGCIGRGLPPQRVFANGSLPAINRGNSIPDYPAGFPTLANETFTSTMASPASTGQTLFEAVQDTFFNERSAIKLAFNNTGTTINEAAGAKGSLAAAQALSLSSLLVPNTVPQFIPGTATPTVNFGKEFDVSAIAVLGNLDVAGQLDFYSFAANAGDLFNFEVISEAATTGGFFRYGNRIDSLISILDSSGNLVPWYGGLAQNDDEFEGFDSLLMDLIIPTTGTYFVQVNAFSAADTGNYELFMHRFNAFTPTATSVPEPGTFGLALLSTGALGLVRRRRGGRRAS